MAFPGRRSSGSSATRSKARSHWLAFLTREFMIEFSNKSANLSKWEPSPMIRGYWMVSVFTCFHICFHWSNIYLHCLVIENLAESDRFPDTTPLTSLDLKVNRSKLSRIEGCSPTDLLFTERQIVLQHFHPYTRKDSASSPAIQQSIGSKSTSLWVKYYFCILLLKNRRDQILNISWNISESCLQSHWQALIAELKEMMLRCSSARWIERKTWSADCLTIQIWKVKGLFTWQTNLWSSERWVLNFQTNLNAVCLCNRFSHFSHV